MRHGTVASRLSAVVQVIAVCVGSAFWAAMAHAPKAAHAVPKAHPPASTGAATGVGVLFVVIAVLSLAFYVYGAVCLQVIAKKTNTANGWLAWIPIANVVLMLNVAQKPVWWLLLVLIPLLNVVIAVIVWMKIAKARAKAEWWGVMMVVPIMNFIAPGYLAFST